ncbi:MAG: polynucleotide adenylyltransferase PcnB [Alcaligenaceae bacterium]|nr:polynucleotide adenylyltransferase PcnB [Alcaligenaceae bacterium]
MPQATIYRADEHQIQKHFISRNAIKVCQVLQEAGHEAYIVGGAVRDLTLGLQPKDFDVATSATPEQVKPLFRRALIIGRRFRLVHCVFGREIIEVSTFRAASKQKQLTDEFGRVLSDNVYGTQAQDAERRDFTINALYYDPIREEVIDYHNGLQDIRQRVVHIIGDAEARYREDPVRMLRAIRFQAKLNGTLEADTAAPIQTMADLLANVPESRLADESLKLLTCGNIPLCLQVIKEHGIGEGILPLIDLIQNQMGHNKFLQIALERTDYRIRSNKTVSPSFLYASALWPLVKQRWHDYQEQHNEPVVPALVQAAHDVLDVYARNLALQRRQSSDMREIWFMQPRFERRSIRAIHRMFEQHRFRAAVDFLQIRTAAGEFDSVLAQWWMDLADADEQTRKEMLAELQHHNITHRTGGDNSEPAKSKRRRRPRRRSSASRNRRTAAKPTTSAHNDND